MSYMIDQRQILFWKMALCSDSMVISILAGINECKINMILCKYHIVSMNKMNKWLISIIVYAEFFLLMSRMIPMAYCSVFTFLFSYGFVCLVHVFYDCVFYAVGVIINKYI